MEDRVRLVFYGLIAVFLFATILFGVFAEMNFASGEILGLPLDYLFVGSFLTLIFLWIGLWVVRWFRRRDE